MPPIDTTRLAAPASCPASTFATAPAELDVATATTMQTLGGCAPRSRYTAEIAVRGTIAYTTTWSRRVAVGNVIYVWDVSGNTPGLIDSVTVGSGINTLGDVAVSDDGKLLVVATEYQPGAIVVYDLADPRHPRELSRFTNDLTNPGVHTAELGRVNGTLYAFLAVDPSSASKPPAPARIVIVDLSKPASPQQVYTKVAGAPFLHDTFLRDGLLFVALWNDGIEIWDLGGAGNGSPAAPRVIGGVKTVGGEVHNIWWYHDASGAKQYAFVGEEGPGAIGSSSVGDIHVVDVSNMASPKEVAFYHVANAGTHNFSVDEANGILYAAYYNGGVRAIDVRGDLGTCAVAQQVTVGGITRCDLAAMGRELGVGLLDQKGPVYVWGVQFLNGFVYASDMLNGIWKLKALSR